VASACLAFVAAVNLFAGRTSNAGIFLFGAIIGGGICLYLRINGRN
jgi:hypothetical protein